MTPAARLTDEVIDSLSGRELDEAVCIALGWRWCTKLKPGIGPELVDPQYLEGRKECKRPARDTIAYHAGKWGMPWTPFYNSDLGAAMGLLLSDPSFWVEIIISNEPAWIEIEDKWTGNVLACGDKANAALHCCRAFLKLKNRS